MSYQVLARKWRPQNFSELVGQQHVVTVLINALQQQRLHHAYLFTGTRGVGKTTIARILAKSLNCEQGITATPCGKCGNCVDIEQGRFVDLLEIDAASRTKVDDTREILDNVQYAPSRGRYKVYLIDEVHMLSRSSFNALLKTLEEPPEHVKFVLATTDPQKLPVTVLSRCLQFHLKALTQAQIVEKLTQILTAEQVSFDQDSLTILAKAARGSMRDCLSLTDQAIAQGKGELKVSNIQQMLGGVDRHWPIKILIALVKQDRQQLFALAQEIASYAPSYSKLATDLLQLLHQIALMQISGQTLNLVAGEQAVVEKLSRAIAPDDVQLFYQIVLNGRKDLAYCGDEQMGFDMLLLRLLSFAPVNLSTAQLNEGQMTAASSAAIDALAEVQLTATQITPNDDQQTINISDKPQTKAIETEQLTTAPIASSDINHIEQNAQFEKQQQALTQEMLAVEQVAQEQGFVLDEQISITQTPPDEHTPQQAPKAPITPADPQITPVMEQEPPSSQIVSTATESAPSVTNEVAEILSTRNMLRSRKKQLAQADNAKKFDQVSASEQAEQNNIQTEQQAEQAPALALDEIQSATDFTVEKIDPVAVKHASQIDHWAHLIEQMQLQGLLKQLAIHAVIEPKSDQNCLYLSLAAEHKHLLNDNSQQKLQQYLQQYFQHTIKVEVEITHEQQANPHVIQQQINDKRWQYAKEILLVDPIVKTLQQEFQATIDEQTIQAH